MIDYAVAETGAGVTGVSKLRDPWIRTSQTLAPPAGLGTSRGHFLLGDKYFQPRRASIVHVYSLPDIGSMQLAELFPEAYGRSLRLLLSSSSAASVSWPRMFLGTEPMAQTLLSYPCDREQLFEYVKLPDVEFAVRLVIDPAFLPLFTEQWPSEGARHVEGLPSPSEVAQWLTQTLGITYDQLAQMTGIGRTTFFAWSRRRAQPRASTMDRLLRLHTLVRVVVEKLGPEEAASWFRRGAPSPLSLLLGQKWDGAEEAVASLVFRDLPFQPEGRAGYRPDERLDLDIAPSKRPLRRSDRPVRRMRLPQE